LAKVRYEAGRPAPYLQLPVALLMDPDIDPHTLTTYAVLKSYCDFGSDSGAYPSDEQAAKRGAMSRRVFIDRRNRLREKGWIEWRNSPGGPNAYKVHATLDDSTDISTQKTQGVQEVHTGCAGDAQGGVQEMHTTYIHLTKIQIPKSRLDEVTRFLPELDELWGFWTDWRARALGLGTPRQQKVTWNRLRPVVDRLLEGYQLSDLKEAVLGCCHREHNVKGGYLDIELICRDQQHVDMYVHHWRQTQRSLKSPTVEQTKMAIEAMYG